MPKSIRIRSSRNSTQHLPTVRAASWAIVGFRDSVLYELNSSTFREMAMYFYAVTLSGWKELRRAFLHWSRRTKGRAIAYIGTDHAITEADALRAMRDDGVEVRLMTSYTGIFHPKVIWLRQHQANHIWIGSNNLTRDGLLYNIEFAALITSRQVPAQFRAWANEVHASSTALTDSLLRSYENERLEYANRRVSVGTFTWTHREAIALPKPKRTRRKVTARRRSELGQTGDLVIEVMPRETGQDGKQIQLPVDAATRFFRMPTPAGASKVISLTPAWTRDSRDLTMTMFRNRTVRLAIRELDYRDRPCLLVFRDRGGARYKFGIVTRSAFPAQYRGLLARCKPATRMGSRRWGILS